MRSQAVLRNRKITTMLGVGLAMAMIGVGVPLSAQAYDGTLSCGASSLWPYTFSYTAPGNPNPHRRTNLDNTSQVTQTVNWQGGNYTTVTGYKRIGYDLGGSYKSAYCD